MCKRCGQERRVPEEIRANGPPACHACAVEGKRERNRERARARRATPEGRAAELAATRRWRKVKHDDYRAAQKRYYEKMMRSPAKHRAVLENRRIREYLRRQRQGTARPPISPEQYAKGNGAAVPRGRVPAVLLVPIIREWLGPFAGQPLDNHNYTDTHAGSYMAGEQTLASLAGVSDRRIRAILKGEQENVNFVTADRLCAALSVPLSMIYTDGR